MRKYCLLFGMVLAISSLQADQSPQIYKWTDSNGNVNFSDKPHAGAEEIALPKVQTYSTPKISVPEPSSEPVTDAEAPVYHKISIVQPVDQTTIRNPQGYVSILIELKPKLKRGDKLQIILDGAPLNKPQATTVFALQDINRGSHTLAAQVVDAQGKILNTSDTISFFMQQPRAGMGTRSP